MSRQLRLDRLAWWLLLATVGATLAIMFTGCRTVNTAALVEQLKDDEATVALSVTSIYGVVKFNRSNPGTNSTVTISPDGTVTIERR